MFFLKREKYKSEKGGRGDSKVLETRDIWASTN